MNSKLVQMRKIFFYLFLLMLTESSAQATYQSLLLYNVSIVNVRDGTIRRNTAVGLEGNKIKAIGAYNDLKSSVAVTNQVDCKGQFLIPGLWDMHVHLEGAELVEDNKALLPVFLAYGITTVRDCASDLGEKVLAWRKEIRDGLLAGPNLFTAGRKLEGKNSIWKGDLEIENTTELRQMLDLLDGYKVDFVKITENTLGGDLFLQSVKEAHARGYRVSGHVPIDVTIQQLSDAGYTSVEHSSYLLRLGSDENAITGDLKSGKITRAEADARYTSTFDQARAVKGYKALGKAGLFVCPTMIGGRELAYLDVTDHSHDVPLSFLTEKYVANYQWRIQRMAGDTPLQKQQRKERYNLLRKQLPLLQQSGITLMAGSDAAALNTYVYPAESLIQEVEIFQESGMTPLQILQAATLNGARYFGITNQTGAIDPGKDADLVLLADNPLEDIRAVRKVQAVVTHGKFYDRKAIDGLLEAARETKRRLDSGR